MRKVALVIASDSKGLILLQQKTYDAPHFPGVWSLFGGSVEEGEDPLSTIVREVKEELGLSIPPEKFLYFKTFMDGEIERSIFTTTFEDSHDAVTLYEGRGLGYFSEEELQVLRTPIHIKKILSDYFSTSKS